MSELKRLKIARAHCKGALTRIESFVREPANIASATIDVLEARKDKLISVLKQYESIQLDILGLDEEDSEDIGEMEDKYYMTLGKINEAIKILNKSEPSQSNCMSSSKLPNVEVPTFDGKDCTKFKPFYELFIAVIDNNRTLSDVQKLFYLRKYLLDEALSVIVNLPLVNKSYQEALTLLKKRFDNKARSICNHINILLDIPPMLKGTAASIRTFISQVQQQLHALKNLDEPIDSWDRVLICILNRKLDSYTIRAFQLERPQSTNITNNGGIYSIFGKTCYGTIVVFLIRRSQLTVANVTL
ncbi:unnamed protein product [Parnassius mnemosyne]|uniref:Uncharacterized protein n=1 Tax=Parnassius mnemosyne TaxID=213953 RepID=A0AAV1LBC0_9NEOP